MVWDPLQYHKFQSERFAPFEDLMSLIRVRGGMRVIDLGCGTGELTRRLADSLPGSDVLGIDSSPDMLAKARTLGRGGLRFEIGKLEEATGDWDLVFSHAAIQWVDDHDSLLDRVWSIVAPGGRIVIQQPSNHYHRAHEAIHETAAEEPFRTALDGWTRLSPVQPVDWYAEKLFKLGASEIVALEKVYPHVLEDSNAIAEWTSGTALVPYFERLGPELRELFMMSYREKLLRRWPVGPVFYGFKRILFAGSKDS